MNAINETEMQAVHAVSELEAADPAKNLIMVPLSKLVKRPSTPNVRKGPVVSVAELAASIERIGLLQNLIVTASAKSGQYEVVAGGRRLKALRLLAKKRRIPKTWDVPCLLVADGTARTASLSENVQREAMHPADQFEAFAALVAEGRSIEDIAADFGVTPLVVQRRMKLANVSPRLLADYRANAVSLEQLMALAIVDDHAAQEAAFYDTPEWQRHPRALRKHLTEQDMDTRHPLVKFVSMSVYEAAGGRTYRDLFAENDDDAYLSDSDLLKRLAQEKLEEAAAPVRAEGWMWVDVAFSVSYAELAAFRRSPLTQRQPTEEEAEKIKALNEALNQISQETLDAAEADEEEKVCELEEKASHLDKLLEKIEDDLMVYTDAVMAMSGAIVTIDQRGELSIHRGLMREAEAKALRLQEKKQTQDGENADGAEDCATADASISDRLARRLSAHRTAAMQIELARQPHVALVATVHSMVTQIMMHETYYYTRRDLPLSLCMQDKTRLELAAPDYPDSPAAEALSALKNALCSTLPCDGAELFDTLHAMDDAKLIELLAVCVASSVDALVARAAEKQSGGELASALGLNMATWWKPTAKSYFDHVSKSAILDFVSKQAPDELANIGKLKKADAAKQAELIAERTGWMPAYFRDIEAAAETPTE